MARPQLDHITDTKKQQQLQCNISAMEEQLFGYSLSNFLRKKEKTGKDGENPFADKLKKEYKPVYDATVCLPPSSTLNKHLTDPEGPPQKTVDCIADFCSKAFNFDEPISADDLLNRDLRPFPFLRRTEQWMRYEGTYRCFYFNPDEKGHTLNGGLLKLKENKHDGRFQAALITGIWRDKYFYDLENLLEGGITDDLHSKCKAYSDSYPDAEMRLVTYQGTVDTQIPGHFLLRLPRVPREKHSNAALVLLRRFDSSAQKNYSGGIATVNLCRADNITSHAMIVVRSKLSLQKDGEFLKTYLNQVDNGVKGMMVTKDLDKDWNRETFARIRDDADGERFD